jgi:Mlc titration factor MtfA (ptsG expression regulator)
MRSLWQRFRQAREERILKRRAIPDELWGLTLARFPFLQREDPQEAQQLRRLATLFLDAKEFTGAQGFEVTDEVAVAVAAQACLPVLHLGLRLYDGFVGIVMHADEIVAPREVMDEDGVVHRYDEVLAGEAMEGGPVTLSWHDVSLAGHSADSGYNVVIHEFIHKIDMLDGEPDGVPPLPGRAARAHWMAVMDAEYEAFCREVDAGMDTWLDPYGAESVDEFFAVAAEAYFVAETDFRLAHPRLADLFDGYFRPARKQGPAGP